MPNPTHYEMVLPAALRDEGNNFMGVVGASLGDLNTFSPNPRWRRIDNHSQTFYKVGFQDEFDFESKIAAPLVPASYDPNEEQTDVADAQTLLDNSDVTPPETPETPLAAPTGLIIGKEVWGIEWYYGLELIPED
jgi:hypothetical protein